MQSIQKQFENHFSTHWIGLNFYKVKPDVPKARHLSDVRFCESTKQAIVYPIILDKNSINCPGALFAFGWKPLTSFYKHCEKKSKLYRNKLQEMIRQMPRLDGTISYIGLNTSNQPDILLSFVTPKQVMSLLYLFHNKEAKSLNVSLSSMTSICGGVAVSTFLRDEIAFSFGCTDSRFYADLGAERLAVGIPHRHFDLVKY